MNISLIVRYRLWPTLSVLIVGLGLATTGSALAGSDKPASTDPPLNKPAKTVTWDFESDLAGALPSGWTVAETAGKGHPGTWRIIADAKAPSGRQVLGLCQTVNEGRTFNLCVRDDTDLADVDLTVRLRADTGTEDQGGGLAWRLSDADNYYVARYNPLEANLRLYTVVKGVRSKPLANAKAVGEAGRWYTLRVVHVGATITVMLDGTKLIEVTDQSTPALSRGKIALWTKADAATSFDDLTVGVPAMALPSSPK